VKHSVFPVAQTVLALACAWAFAGLLADAWFEVSSGYLSGDALIFQTVGRGILNGLKPWSDLFETKPPAVFILHALSLKMFGSQLLVKIVQAVALLSIPVVTLVAAVHQTDSVHPYIRRIISLTAFLFGTVLALYTGNQGGYGLAESYGAALGVGYVAAAGVQLPVFRRRWRSIALLGLLMLGSVGCKEPFVLSILSAVVLLAPRTGMREFVSFFISGFVIPALIAAVIGVAALFFLGWWTPFFDVYLPHMLGFHVFQHDVPMPLRALEIWRTWEHLFIYSPFLAAAIAILWGAVPILFVASKDQRMDKVSLVLRWVVASYFALLSIAVGGDFYGHHFLFALPFYLALFLILVRRGSTTGIAALFAVTLVFVAFTGTQFDYGSLAEHWQKEETHLRSVAATIDDVMERCGYEHYLQQIARGGGPYAFTKASPYGPIFIHYSRFIGASKEYQRAYLTALQETKLILMNTIEDSNLSEYALQYMSVHFSEEPPACAGEDFSQPKPYKLLFAKRRENI